LAAANARHERDLRAMRTAFDQRLGALEQAMGTSVGDGKVAAR
jgi:hypothetical protein